MNYLFAGSDTYPSPISHSERRAEADCDLRLTFLHGEPGLADAFDSEPRVRASPAGISRPGSALSPLAISKRPPFSIWRSLASSPSPEPS